MKDANGIYYYPNPADTTTRVYVRNSISGVQFRMWHSQRPEVWEKHGWLDMQVIEAAATMYKDMKQGVDPMLLYDAAVATALLKAEDN